MAVAEQNQVAGDADSFQDSATRHTTRRSDDIMMSCKKESTEKQDVRDDAGIAKWFEFVGAARATELLARSKNVRARSAVQETKYVNDMLADRWALCPDPITLDEQGWMINGQTRCSAIIATDRDAPGFRVRCEFCSGPFTYEGIDEGRARRSVDLARARGIPNPSKTMAVAAALWALREVGQSYTWTCDRVGPNRRIRTQSHRQKEDYASANAAEILWAIEASAEVGRRVGSQSVYIAVSFAECARVIGRHLVTGFADSVTAEIATTLAASNFRERFPSLAIAKGRAPQGRDIWTLTVWSIRHFVDGTRGVRFPKHVKMNHLPRISDVFRDFIAGDDTLIEHGTSGPRPLDPHQGTALGAAGDPG